MSPCILKTCIEVTDHVSGYCSDICLQAEQDFDSPPVTVLARGKAGGFGRSLEWQVRKPVAIPAARPA